MGKDNLDKLTSQMRDLSEEIFMGNPGEERVHEIVVEQKGLAKEIRIEMENKPTEGQIGRVAGMKNAESRAKFAKKGIIFRDSNKD